MKEKLKELREKRGLSQAEVAQEIDILRQMYNKYERGYILRTNLNYRNKSLNNQIPTGE